MRNVRYYAIDLNHGLPIHQNVNDISAIKCTNVEAAYSISRVYSQYKS